MIDAKTLAASNNRQRAYQAIRAWRTTLACLNDAQHVGSSTISVGPDARMTLSHYAHEGEHGQSYDYTLTVHCAIGSGVRTRTDQLDWQTVSTKLRRAIERKIARLERTTHS